MALLHTPPNHHELNTSLSLQGVTILKDGRYNLRHSGLKNLVILPDGKISYYEKPTSNPDNKKSRLLRAKTLTFDTPTPEATEPPQISIQNKKRYYTLKKTLVRQRLLTYILCQRGEKKLYFLTITFPPIVTDLKAYKYFNQWLTVLRQKQWIRDYLWIAERQKNGTIHYHMAISKRVPITNINRAMSVILANEVRKKQLDWNLQAAKRYNGVDLSKNRKTGRVTNFAIKKGTKSLANYLTKYVTKNNETFETYCWHCSRVFSNLVIKVNLTANEFNQSTYHQYTNIKKGFETEYCIFIPWLTDPPDSFSNYLIHCNNEVQDFIIREEQKN